MKLRGRGSLRKGDGGDPGDVEIRPCQQLGKRRREKHNRTEQETETGQKQAHERKTDCGVVDLPSEAIHCDERSIDVR
jgi:hypothetical protein